MQVDDRSNGSRERLLDALAEFDAALARNVARSEEMRRRIGAARHRLLAGDPIGPIVESEPQPRMVEMLSENIDTLHGAGSRLRSAQALALRSDGFTITEIAELFGVTRQRVSALLRQKSARHADPEVVPANPEHVSADR